MQKSILVTGSTDGIGFETAKMLVADGHRVLLHGRSREKLAAAARAIGAGADGYLADLSSFSDIRALAEAVAADHPGIDVLINNAGVFKTPHPVTPDGLDVRFVVNTLAPYALARRLLPSMGRDGRIVNLSSAAQVPVNVEAMMGRVRLSDMEAYAQSKLALTMWSTAMAEGLADGPVVVAVNPGSLLASKMVREGFGVAGSDIRIGADILTRAALSPAFAGASGRYFDNDIGRFGPPHPDALDPAKCRSVVNAVDALLDRRNL